MDSKIGVYYIKHIKRHISPSYGLQLNSPTITGKIYDSVKKSSKIGQDEETLVSVFLPNFWSLVPKFYF